MTEADLRHLRRAIGLARRARERGNAPLGALLVDEHGAVLLEAETRELRSVIAPPTPKPT